ncbi:acetoacetyl-CoA reductase [Natronocella acetinitrilica]|jgi:acetoacetyl-CoA reductase|uniref:Acetoacetyl-CoA reductase n=1 Tax=Natronocella acetinitrilica TaxID=414046 RepID=A0AAE3G578_9GAMM|nr:acetoacetyl-CoA reductase [Natronocella acetinitrilica]MCP1675269.1 acetoacetyl-CoA reductase [Natronocella acetinitrilica]
MGRVALVTGGTRGIGGAISRGLKAAGHTVAATYHGNDEAAEAFRKETGIAVFKWDVGDFDACQAGLEKVAAELGPVEVLVNNAGITKDGMLHKMAADQWNAVIQTNLTSAFNMCRAAIAGMRESGFGRIVNIASVNGQKGQMGQTNYAAAKAGLIGFSKSLALETAAKGITVNVVAPGYTETDMVAAVPQNVLDKIVAQIPVGRLGQADEIAHSVCFLASKEAGFITGATISINGGQYMA